MVERDRYIGGSKPRLNEKLQKTVLKDQKLSANLCRLLGLETRHRKCPNSVNRNGPSSVDVDGLARRPLLWE